MKDYNSSENQRIKGEFIKNEVYCCASSLIYQLQEDGHYQDDIMEFSYKEGLREEDLITEIKENYEEELKEYIENTFTEITDIEDLNEEELRELADDLNIDIDNFTEPEEALEHWIVSGWLADKLEEYGELITKDFLGLTIWGRTCSGQAIMLDYVISKICDDLDMLK